MPDQTRNDLIALLSDESFQRWLAGKASPDEISHWTQWVSESPRHEELRAHALKLWRLMRFRPAALPDIAQELQKLQQRLAAPKTKSAASSDLTIPRAAQRHERAPDFAWNRFGALAAAAVIVMAVLGTYLSWSKRSARDQTQSIATTFGERTQLVLPDSSKIILNANSSLHYPAVWTATTPRRFDLKGEAYFEVASRQQGPQHDFVVHTNDGTVRVVGTHFVVYDRGRGTRVVVAEGGVEVAVADTVSTSPLAKALLTPGNFVHFYKGSRTLAPSSVPPGPDMTWWRDQLVLQNTPFEQVLHRLEETYGIHMEVKDEHLLKRKLSGTIENRNLEVIAEALARALRVAVRREGQTVIFGN